MSILIKDFEILNRLPGVDNVYCRFIFHIFRSAIFIFYYIVDSNKFDKYKKNILILSEQWELSTFIGKVKLQTLP